MPRVDRVAEKQREGGLVDGAVACELSGHPTKEVFLQVFDPNTVDKPQF